MVSLHQIFYSSRYNHPWFQANDFHSWWCKDRFLFHIFLNKILSLKITEKIYYQEVQFVKMLNQFEFDAVALELKICKSEFPDRENRGYNDYDSFASSKPSTFIENTGT